jgi:DNA (cytosine-5)-methyltransferase 1
VGIDGILAEMEGQGYEIGLLDIPACSVGTPHIRHRLWIVGYLAKPCDTGTWSGGEPAPDQRRPAVDACGEGLRQGNRETCPDGFEAGIDGHLANAECSRSDRQTISVCGEEPRQVPVSSGSGQSHLANTCGTERTSWNVRPKHTQGTYPELAGSGIWDSHVWMPCAEGKVRRAPDDTVRLVDGLHRSLLGALGNSIVPQVAAEIMKAIKEVDSWQT